MQLTAKQKQILSKLCESLGIKLLLLHGSRAINKARSDSDIDIAFLCLKKELETSEFLQLHTALFKTLNTDSEIDLHSLHRKDPLFKYQIAKSAKLLVGSVDDFDDFRLHAYAQYNDSRDLRELERKLIEKQQLRWKDSDG